MNEKYQRVYFIASAAILLFAAGFATAWRGGFPTTLIHEAAGEIKDWRKYPGHRLRRRPEKFLSPVKMVPENVRRPTGFGSYPGQTLLTGFFGDGPAIRLVDHDGRTLHEWRVSFREVFPDVSHLEGVPAVPEHDWDIHLHGAHLFPNGDVVFNFEWGGLVRVDRCSRVVWKLARQTHHSIKVDDEGNLWVPDRKRLLVGSGRFPDVPVPAWDDRLTKVSPDGRVLQEISLIEAFYKSGSEALLSANGQHGAHVDLPDDGDFMHLNDVEALSEDMAPAFPMFSAGDLLVSLRNLNSVMVLSPETGKIKWWMVGPFIRQHDPDFVPSGHIVVFDNRLDSGNGHVRGGSRLLAIDPATRKVEVVYGGERGQFFYTKTQGASQRLPNGNYLVAVTEAGYVFEVTPDDEVAWSYVNRYDEKSVAWIESAQRYPPDYMADPGRGGCT